MRNFILAGMALILLALNWAALHDILKGEPNVWMEWSFVIGSAFLVVVYLIRKARQPA